MLCLRVITLCREIDNVYIQLHNVKLPKTFKNHKHINWVAMK